MKRIGVISDTHGLLRDEAVGVLKECDVILHAGDIDRQGIIDKLSELRPLYAVRGNADKEWAERLPDDLTVELFGYRIYMIHNKKNISEKAADADIVIYGHSHKYDEKETGGQLWLNPGSCGKRRFTLPITMAVIEIDEDGRLQVIRKDIAGEKAVPTDVGRDLSEVVKLVVKEFKKGSPVDTIVKKCGISMELAEQICRMYSTHPGIDVDGILNRITK